MNATIATETPIGGSLQPDCSAAVSINTTCQQCGEDCGIWQEVRDRARTPERMDNTLDIRTADAPPGSLERLVRQLLDEARYRKRRVRQRLSELRGDWIRHPVRGPILPNGRKSPQWQFYCNAVSNHHAACRQLKAMLRILPNTQAQRRRATERRKHRAEHPPSAGVIG
jgi:hypothetical protein